mmetsp:Transcript_10538/g.15835  ORF Transcript_10538/g.15835 Transcript_10538/m.15835 type:complete len:465 (+) Transcript_10538:2382-3776(+)
MIFFQLFSSTNFSCTVSWLYVVHVMLHNRMMKKIKGNKRGYSALLFTAPYPSLNRYLTFFVLTCFMIALYLLYPSNVPFTQQSKSMLCKPKQSTTQSNGNTIINDICSLTHALNIDTWSDRECYIKHPAEGHWFGGYFMTAWYKLTKNQHCKTINIHHFLSTPHSQSIDIDNYRNDNEDNVKNNNKFTILINTWQRNQCLINSVRHYLECSRVAQIRVIWSDPSNDVPSSLRTLQQSLSDPQRLVFDEYKDNKLTNRFKYNSEWKTEAIFQTDDDIMFSCALLENTFKLWQSLPDYMIGYAPREPYKQYRQRKTAQFYTWDEPFTQCRYSLLFVTLGGFMHRKYYEMYDAMDINGVPNGWRQAKDAVNGNITAEDISMSMLYTFQSGLPPITVTVPESEMLIKPFLACQEHKSLIMHTDSRRKRTDIFFDILNLLESNQNEALLRHNELFVDVMPVNDQKCWAG